MKTVQDFNLTYDRLSESGLCDDVGGMEYERVLKEWQEMGCPSNLETFIVARANVSSHGESIANLN